MSAPAPTCATLTIPGLPEGGPYIDPEALAAIARGECPDGGGPQCVCKALGKPGQCVCTTCDDDGRFRIGMFTDHCGNCYGTKFLDDRVWDALDEGGCSSRDSELSP